MGSIRNKNGWFYFRYYKPDGKRYEVALHTRNYEIAMRLKKIYETQIEQNIDPSGFANTTFGEAVQKFIDFIFPQKSPRRQKEIVLCLKRLNKLDNIPIRRITTETILAVLDNMRQNGLSRSSQIKALQIVKAFFRWAVNRGYIIINPAAEIKIKRDEKRKRVRFFSREELVKIFETANKLYADIAPIFEFLYYTGLRRSEALTLKWVDINFTHNNLCVRDSKTPAGYRQIPLVDEAVKILEQAKVNNDTEWVFINPYLKTPWHKATITHRFQIILKKCGIKDASLHTLRHTFASNLAMSGVSLDIIRDLLGHTSIVITEIYAHLAPDHLKQAIQSLPKIK